MPPLLQGGALLLWGWNASVPVVALVMGLLLEAPRLVPWRWQARRTHFNRLGDLSSVLLVAVLIWAFSAEHHDPPLFVLLRALPLIMFPLAVSLIWSSRDKLPVSALLMTVRKLDERSNGTVVPDVDFAYPYLGICLVSAGVTEQANQWFFPLAAGLIGWGLWAERNRSFRIWTWVLVFVTGTGMGYAGQIGLSRLQKVITEQAIEWFGNWMYGDPDPYRRNSDIGSVGALKMSDGIVFRVDAGPPGAQTLLLRESSFNFYYNRGWSAFGSAFKPVENRSDEASWRLDRTGVAPGRWLTLYKPFHGGRGLLPVPDGAVRIDDLPGSHMQVNQFGAIKVFGAPEHPAVRIGFVSGLDLDGPPTAEDLRIPDHEQQTLARIATELGLKRLPPGQALAAVKGFFLKEFRYSTYLESPAWGATPLEDFLLRTRRGHCEYFATATVLLLRSAGIPARYAVGYALLEHDAALGLHVVRRRHAHAWVLAYVDGAWTTLDTTPPGWFDLESGQEGTWRALLDLASHNLFRVRRWYAGGGRGQVRDGLPWLGVALLLLYAYRQRRLSLFSIKFGRTSDTSSGPGGSDATHALFAIERRLALQGHGRLRGETWMAWCRRIGQPSLRPIVQLYNRVRFDPAGVDEAARQRLDAQVDHWLQHDRMHAEKSRVSTTLDL